LPGVDARHWIQLLGSASNLADVRNDAAAIAALAAESRRLAETTGSEQARHMAAGRRLLAAIMDDPDHGGAVAGGTLAAYRDDQDSTVVMFAHEALAVARARRRRYGEAERHLKGWLDWLVRTEFGTVLTYVQAHLGLVRLLQADPAGAADWFTRAAATERAR